MKPTKRQMRIMEFCIGIIGTWENTNDITSPTHFNDLHDFLFADLEDTLKDDQLECLENKLSDVLWLIKKYD